MDLSSLTISIPVAITVVGTFIGIMNFFSGRKKTTQEDEARLVRIEASVKVIENNTSDLRNKVDNHEARLNEHETRISICEYKNNTKKED